MIYYLIFKLYLFNLINKIIECLSCFIYSSLTIVTEATSEGTCACDDGFYS